MFVILGDGECNEGSIWEAALCAGKHALSNLTVIVDYNKRQSYGTVDDVQPLEPFADKWSAFGFMPWTVQGHDVEALRLAFQAEANTPIAIIAHTVKGKGVPECEDAPLWHHKDVFTHSDAERLLVGLGELPCECGCGRVCIGGFLEAAHVEDYRYERG